MIDMGRREEGRRWRPRPLLSFALRFVSVLIPAASGVAGAFGFVALIPMPAGVVLLPWLLGLVASSTLATAVAERIGKRFLPLAVLFRLSLVFPDRAPSRFVMARGAGNIRNLERRIREARDQGVDQEPVKAAKQILALVAALSAHDRKTRGHSERVRAFTDLVAGELKLREADRDRLRWAALLHDVGKIHVPARILNKPDRPDAGEWERLQAHPAMGARIAEPLLPWLGPWGDAIEQHHERFGGGGYPRSLVGEEISLAARIVSVADSFEVMTAPRSYKKPMSVPAARRELATCAGTQFDPAIVRAFLNVSLGRLWWTVGPMSWTALAPVIGPVQRTGGQLAAAAKGATAAAVVGAAGFLPVIAGTAAASDPHPSFRGPTAEQHAADEVRGGEGSRGSGDHAGAPGDGQGSGTREGPPSGGGTGGTSEPPAHVVDALDDPAGTVNDAGDAANDVVDGTTDLVDGLLDGTTVSDLVDEPVPEITEDLIADRSDVLGGFLAS